MTKQIISASKIVALAVVLSFGLSYVYAWTAPSATPPTGNVSAPINTGDNTQYKAGNLVLNDSLFPFTNGLIVRYGNVGIGTTNPANRLSVQQSNNVTLGSAATYGIALTNGTTDVLTLGYDANNAYIQSFANLPLQINNQGNDTLMNVGGGKVGIGTPTPAEKLDVAGNIKASGTICDGSNNCIGSGVASAWVKFSSIGGVVSVANWYNVSSVVRNSAGNYTVNFSTPMATAHYVAVSSAGPYPNWTYPTAQTASSYTFTVHHPNYGANDNNSIISVVVMQ